MAQSQAALWPLGAFRRAASLTAGAVSRNPRVSAVMCVILIFACFAAAAALQMRRDHANALQQAETFTAERARLLAAQAAYEFDRIAALTRAFAALPFEDEEVLARLLNSADRDEVLNIAVADRDGRVLRALWGEPALAGRVPGARVAAALSGPTVAEFADPMLGRTPLALFVPVEGDIAFALVDPDRLFDRPVLAGSAIAAADGTLLALGPGWEAAPPASRLAARRGESVQYIKLAGVRRLLAVSPVPGWAAAASASVRAGDALQAWYGSVPLYLFVILAPGIAGAVLALLLVREFERGRERETALKRARAAERAEAAALACLAQAELRAADASRSKEEFIANMSHDLRTPLNAMIGFAEIIAKGLFGPAGHPKYAEYAGDIATAGHALHDRVSEVLEFAKLDCERQPLELAPTDLGGLVEECLDRMAGIAFSRRIRVSAAISRLPRALADAKAIKRILTNLVSNALRYTPEGGAVRIEAAVEHSAIVLTVRDEGLGFEPREMAEAGVPFVRFDRPGAEAGLGLGLAVATALARRMGGALEVKGAAGEGTWAKLSLRKA